jgi:hypothetical protein
MQHEPSLPGLYGSLCRESQEGTLLVEAHGDLLFNGINSLDHPQSLGI